MEHLSDAYKAGLGSRCPDNPYGKGTQEHDDFERGWLQRLKRCPDSVSSKFSEAPVKFQERYTKEPKPPCSKNSCTGGGYNAYAAAKGK